MIASACSAPRSLEPTPPPGGDPTAGLSVPDGPVLFEPEQLIFPPEEFPLPGAAVARDAPLSAHGWERQFATPASADFRWFTIRLFVLEPDVSSGRFMADNSCGSARWPDERPSAKELVAPRSGEDANACRYEFPGGARVLYYTTGYRNVGVLVGTQPRRDEVSDELGLDWLAALARRQIAIVGRILAAVPPPSLRPYAPAEPVTSHEPASTAEPTATPFAFEPPVDLPAAVGGKPYSFAFTVAPRGGRPPYDFRLGPGGFTPIGLALAPNGTLAGTPMATTDTRTYQFSVCVADSAKASICREVHLKVEVAR